MSAIDTVHFGTTSGDEDPLDVRTILAATTAVAPNDIDTPEAWVSQFRLVLSQYNRARGEVSQTDKEITVAKTKRNAESAKRQIHSKTKPTRKGSPINAPGQKTSDPFEALQQAKTDAEAARKVAWEALDAVIQRHTELDLAPTLVGDTQYFFSRSHLYDYPTSTLVKSTQETWPDAKTAKKIKDEYKQTIAQRRRSQSERGLERWKAGQKDQWLGYLRITDPQDAPIYIIKLRQVGGSDAEMVKAMLQNRSLPETMKARLTDKSPNVHAKDAFLPASDA